MLTSSNCVAVHGQLQFLDMSSLQAVLPNGQMPTSFTGGVTEPWFAENPIAPFIPAGSHGT